MKQFVVLFLIIFAASADWKTCADNIIKLEKDLVDLGAIVQKAVEETFIPDVQKITEVCKKTNGWAQCAEYIFKFGENIVQFGVQLEKYVKSILIVDVKLIIEVCKKADLENNVNDWPTCLEDIAKIAEIAKKITDDIKKFNFIQLVKDVKELYDLVQKALQDCTKSNLKMSPLPDDWPACIEDIGKIVEIAGKITDDIKKLDFPALVKDVQELYNTVQKAIQDCTKQTFSLEQSENDWPACIEDIGKIVEIAGKITDDIKKLDFPALVKDVQELYNTVQKAIQDCTKQTFSLELNEDDWPACIEDIGKIVEIAGKITDDIKKLDFPALVKDVQELYNTVQKAIQDCTKQRFSLEESENDWPTCIEDIGKIVEIAGKITDDIKKLDFAALVKDVQELYNTVQKAIQDCTKSNIVFEPNDWAACLEDISKIVEIADNITQDIKKFDFVKLVKDL